MAINGNMFALLGGDDVENLTSHSAANAAEPPSAVVNRGENGRKNPLASSQTPSAAEKPLASFKLSSKPQRSSDHDSARHVNGVKRSEENGVKRYHGHENVSNRGGSDFKRNNGYRHDEMPNGALNRKHYEKRPNGSSSQKQYEKRPNGSLNRKQYEKQPNGSLSRKQYEKLCNGEETSNGGDGWEVVVRRRPNVGETERYHSKDDRIRRSNSGGNNRVNGVFNGGHRHAVAGDQGNDNGNSSASIEEANAGSKGDDGAADEASKESEKKHDADETSKESEKKHDVDLRRERRMAEREMEAKRMTLSQYEEKLQEKRKGLESMKAHEQRIATLDKDFESMHVIEKKKQETIFVKLDTDNDKLKKWTTHNNVDDKITNFKIAGTNYTRRHKGRYNRVEKGNVVEGVVEKGNVVEGVIKKAPPAPPSPHDAKEFPALGSTKELTAQAPIESTRYHQ